ncbi:1-acylglycerol-3-phosphate O-acyltransferase [Ceratocystis pirilliformis]|uniref:1-acyl-sn-glycerol-3-phosphate acyltransferase n=1 Tax=Ceratocystis pirilliformis TaxID=259994 RepID=A0ABR3ZKQ0_9PEZI
MAVYMSGMIASAAGFFAAIVMRMVGQNHSAQWFGGRVMKHICSTLLGLSFEVIDPKNHLGTVQPAVFVGNHQTELDVLMLGCMFPTHCSITAKSSLKKVPILGWFMALSGAIFINRTNSQGARGVVSAAGQEMKRRNQSVYMFPEGTRSYSKEPMLLPFKKGAFHLAVETGVPIVPCVVANYSHVLYAKDWVFNAGRIPVKVLDPIPTKGLAADDVSALCEKVRKLMYEELIVLTSEAQGKKFEMPPMDS